MSLPLYMPSRPLLERQVSRRLQAIGNVTIHDAQDVAEVPNGALGYGCSTS
jgi:hypothetical protein